MFATHDLPSVTGATVTLPARRAPWTVIGLSIASSSSTLTLGAAPIFPGPKPRGTLQKRRPQRKSSLPTYEIPRSLQCHRGPRKFALLVGLQYGVLRGEPKPTWPALRLPHRDMRRLYDVLKNYGFRICMMLDAEDEPKHTRPTRANILRELHNLTKFVRSGDKVVFFYSGHGYQIPTSDPLEEDKFAEYIVPLDSASSGYIIDNTLNSVLYRRLPPGATLFTFFDSCHSGTILDYRNNWDLRNGTLQPRHMFPPLLSVVVPLVDAIGTRTSVFKNLYPLAVCFSAARDELIAWERCKASFLKFFTHFLAKSPHMSIRAAFEMSGNGINKVLARPTKTIGPPQHTVPSLSSSNPCLDMTQPLSTWF
ncbi:hypothetical protein EXIGLDRAFT_70207 [Exidia glandulosa HHB12029]|uniref:Peptidase C14 caspase domain-containing protein n=1 Tax=Exidia glandulosa HHB12029 TaxID=1314781 RepID=A0A165HZP4_EXIGL|nr:hypothetical protein EXIGLDRAFT_70207 [Exidia glandulosa HHB12029]